MQRNQRTPIQEWFHQRAQHSQSGVRDPFPEGGARPPDPDSPAACGTVEGRCFVHGPQCPRRPTDGPPIVIDQDGNTEGD